MKGLEDGTKQVEFISAVGSTYNASIPVTPAPYNGWSFWESIGTLHTLGLVPPDHARTRDAAGSSAVLKLLISSYVGQHASVRLHHERDALEVETSRMKSKHK
jgi:hypothetical protein